MDPGAPPLRLADSSGTAGGEAASASSSSFASLSRLSWLETNMPGELAKAFLLGGQLGRAHQCVARCFDR